jgi:hypothetical protein
MSGMRLQGIGGASPAEIPSARGAFSRLMALSFGSWETLLGSLGDPSVHMAAYSRDILLE